MVHGMGGVDTTVGPWATHAACLYVPTYMSAFTRGASRTAHPTHFQLSLDAFKGYWRAKISFDIGQGIDVDIGLQIGRGRRCQ